MGVNKRKIIYIAFIVCLLTVSSSICNHTISGTSAESGPPFATKEEARAYAIAHKDKQDNVLQPAHDRVGGYEQERADKMDMQGFEDSSNSIPKRICQSYTPTEDETLEQIAVTIARTGSISSSWDDLFMHIYESYTDWKNEQNIVATDIIENTMNWPLNHYSYRTFDFSSHNMQLEAGETYYFEIDPSFESSYKNIYELAYAESGLYWDQELRTILEPVADTHVSQENPSNSYGSRNLMEIRNNDGWLWYNEYEKRGLIKFDLGGQIFDANDKAVLRLTYYTYDHSAEDPAGRTIEMHRNTENFNEYATWTSRPDYDSSISAHGTVPSQAYTTVPFDVSADVSYFVNFPGLYPNYGWSIRDPEAYNNPDIPTSWWITSDWSAMSQYQPRLYLYDYFQEYREDAYNGGQVYMHYHWWNWAWQDNYESHTKKDLRFKVISLSENNPPVNAHLRIKKSDQNDAGWEIVSESAEELHLYEDVYIKDMQYWASDPDECPLRYRFDFGNGWTGWTDQFPEGEVQYMDDYYQDDPVPGGIAYKIQAKDHHDATSNPNCVTVDWEEKCLFFHERPPSRPTMPTGSTSPYIAGETETFSTSSTDFRDNEDIKYIFDWGEGNETETDYKSSGATVYAGHSWRWSGIYDVRVKAIDSKGAESDWSPINAVNVLTGPPHVTTLSPQVLTTSQVKLRGKINDDGGDRDGCAAGYKYSDSSTTVASGTSVWPESGIYTDEEFEEIFYGQFDQGVLYYYRALADNDAADESTASNTKWFLTKPDPVSSVGTTMTSHSSIELVWTNNDGGKGASIDWICTTTGSTGSQKVEGNSFNFTDMDPGYYEFTLTSFAKDNIGGTWKESTGSDIAPYGESRTVTGEILYVPVVETRNATNVQNTQAQLNGYLEQWGGEPCDVWFEYGTTYPLLGETSKHFNLGDDTHFSSTISGIPTGTLVIYRAIAHNSKGKNHGEYKELVTKPEDISNVHVAPKNVSTMNITWINGLGGKGVYIEYATDAPLSPWEPGDGTPIPGGGYISGTSYPHQGLLHNESYYYKLWPYAEDRGRRSDGTSAKPFGTAVQADNVTRLKPVLTDLNAINITNTTAELTIDVDNSGAISTVWFEYGENPGTLTNTTATTELLEGTVTVEITDLKIVMGYYYRARATNYEGETITVTKWFLTAPSPPTNFKIDEYGEDHVILSWQKGLGADTTHITAKYDAYPTTQTNGRLVVNTTETNHTDMDFTNYVNIHYSAWSYNETGDVYSHQAAYVNTTVFDYEVFLPNYLEVGDYVVSWGKINSKTDQPVVGFVANTTVKNNTYKQVLGPVFWNCSDGNYQTTIPTTGLEPGEYIINVRFANRRGTQMLFDYESPLHLSKEIDENNTNTYAPATIHYSFYDIATGTGLDDNFYKIYISYDEDFSAGDRVKGGEIQTIRSESQTVFMGRSYYIQLRDFNNNIIPLSSYDSDKLTTYTRNGVNDAYGKFNISHPEYYIDVGVYLNQVRIKNMNASTVYISLKRTDGDPGQILGRFIPPWEETEVFVPDGIYNLTADFYNNQHPERGPYKRTYPWGQDTPISADYFTWINGSSLESVIETVKGTDAWIHYSIIDANSGSKLEDDLHPIYFSEDTYFNEHDRVLGGKYPISLGDTIHYRITDYWGNTIYPTDGSLYDNITVESYETFLDIYVPMNQLLIKNENESLVYYRLTTGNFSDPANNTWYNRWIPSGESAELFIRDGIYNASIEYYYPHNATCRKIERQYNISIDRDTFKVIIGKKARVYFNIYDTDTGLGENSEKIKTYVDDIRLTNEYIDTNRGNNHSITIKDYYGQIIYNSSFVIQNDISYIDIPLGLEQCKIHNMKHTYFVAALNKSNQTRRWEQTVGPYESISYTLLPGNYTLKIYNQTTTIYDNHISINDTSAYVIFENTTQTAVQDIQQSMDNKVDKELKAALEEYNVSNEKILTLIDFHPYFNETITSLRQEFRKTHTLVIPSLKEKYEDTTPPQSTITAVTTFRGDIRITWNSVDDSGSFAQHTDISYKKENASHWKPWQNKTNPYGSLLFNESVDDLINGSTYYFRAIGTDTNNNSEKPNDINTVSITYMEKELGEPWTAESIVREAALQWIFIVAAIGIALLVFIVLWVERKKEKQAEKIAKRVGNNRYYVQQQEQYQDYR